MVEDALAVVVFFFGPAVVFFLPKMASQPSEKSLVSASPTRTILTVMTPGTE